jgi:predicted FMN-binding regulatory protein PaiB
VRPNPIHACDDPDVVRELIADNPWATHFERHVQEPMLLDEQTGTRLEPGTVGIRLAITRFECKRKLSQDKDPISRRQVIDALRAPGRYRHPELADEMEQALSDESG